MSEDISADAVPFTGHDRLASSEVSTAPTLARLSSETDQEEHCCKIMENIDINNSENDNTSEEHLPMVEPMAESSDSNDSNGAEETVVEYQKNDNTNKTATGQNNRHNQIQNQIIIQNPTGIVHLGPTYNISVGQAFTQVNSNTAAANNTPSKDNTNSAEVDANTPSKEYMRPLWYSNRVIAGDELLRISKNIGSNWKSVGNGLKFNWAQLDQFESDTKCLSDAVHRMLFRWLQWKDQKATVGRLTKVLFNHKEFDAIRCLTP